jgi:hypothetical protein
VNELKKFLFAVICLLSAFIIIIDNINAKPVEYKIGDTGPAGGWIFYDKGDSKGGWRYLEAAPEDQGNNAFYGCVNTYTVHGNSNKEVGKGKVNTMAIIKGCKEPKIAARLCTEYRGGGKKDWFLPSKDELNLMFENLYKNKIGNLDGEYLSSTEGFANGVYYQRFWGDGEFRDTAKFTRMKVRAIRAF